MPGTIRRFSKLIVAVLLLGTALAAAGCAEGGGMGAGSTMAGGNVQADAPAGMKLDPDAQNCAACTTGETAEAVEGATVMIDGNQTINVTIKDGTYVPNRFVANATAPVVVTFTVEGKPATGCVSNPTFKQLDKTLEVTEGTKSIELGTLAPGTYDFTCGMGRPVGQSVVE